MYCHYWLNIKTTVFLIFLERTDWAFVKAYEQDSKKYKAESG